MICINCENIMEKKDIENLSLNNNQCEYCRMTSKKIIKLVEKSQLIYKKRIYNDILNSNFNNEYDFLKKYVLDNSVECVELDNKNEILKILYQIIGKLTDDIKSTIARNPSAFLVSLLTFLEYNLLLTLQVLEIINNFNDKKITEFDNDELSIFLFTMFRDFKDRDEQITKEVFGEIQKILTLDKQSFQYLIKIIGKEIHINKNCKKIFEMYDINNSDLENLLNLSRNYGMLNAICESYLNGIYNIKKIVINKEEFSIKYEEDKFNFNYRKFIDDMSATKVYSELPNAFNERKDEVINKYLGIKTDNLFKAIDNLGKLFNQGDDFLIGGYNSFVKLFEEIMEISNTNAIKIANIFIMDYSHVDYTWINNRPLQKCLINIFDDVLCVPLNVLAYSIINFIVTMFSNKMIDDDFDKEMQTLKEELNNKFELDIGEMIRSNFIDSVVKVNVRQKDIFIEKRKQALQLPGEIDVLAFIKGCLFIIECKDFDLRIDFEQHKNELRYIRKAQKKLTPKIEAINKNMEYVLEYLNIEKSKLKSHKIKGIIVTNNFSIANFSKEFKYPTVNSVNLINYIRCII